MKTFRIRVPFLLLAALMPACFTDHSLAQELQSAAETPIAASAVTIDVAAYANLCGVWKYRRTEDGVTETWKHRMLGTTQRAGKPVYIRQTYSSGGYPNDQFFYSADLSKGLYEVGGLNDYGKPSEETFKWTPTVPLLMKVFKPGVWYSSIHVHSGFPGEVKLMMKTEPDKIRVPYGNLDCYKVTHSYSQDGKVLLVNEHWYARNLGQVKKVGEGSVRELVSYTPAPWLVAEQPAGSALYDAVGNKAFGSTAVGKTGMTKTFTFRNLGTKSLTGLAVAKNGNQAKDFIVSGPANTTLAPGATTIIKVTFKPTASGTREAAIHIAHNESKDNPFDIKLSGLGVAP